MRIFEKILSQFKINLASNKLFLLKQFSANEYVKVSNFFIIDLKLLCIKNKVCNH